MCVCAEKKLSSWKLIGDRSNEINRRGFYEITCEAKYELGILSFLFWREYMMSKINSINTCQGYLN